MEAKTLYFLVDPDGNIVIQANPPTPAQKLACVVFVDDHDAAVNYAYSQRKKL